MNMKAITKKTKQKRQIRSAANIVSQQKRNAHGAPGFADNRPGPAAVRRTSISNGPAASSTFVRLYPSSQAFQAFRTPIQRLSLEYYTKAIIRWASTADSHITRQEILNQLAIYYRQIVVGKSKMIIIGDGLRRGWKYGNIQYNCSYDEDQECHIIHVYHAHDGESMG